MNKKIFIHAVYAQDSIFVCHHPECSFTTADLTAVAEHTVKNQFKVVEEKQSRPADLFKI